MSEEEERARRGDDAGGAGVDVGADETAAACGSPGADA